MAEQEPIIPDSMESLVEQFHYYPGILVGDELTISGQLGRDENLNPVEGKKPQFRKAFENVGLVLEEAGADFDDVVEMTTYHTDMRDLETFIEVKDQYFVDDYPTWTGVQVANLSMPGLYVEIQCRALL